MTESNFSVVQSGSGPSMMTSSSGRGHPELEAQSSPRGFEHRHLPAEAILGKEIPIYQGNVVVIPSTSVEAMGLCSNPPWTV